MKSALRSTDAWTFGAEHELSDWPRRDAAGSPVPLPPGWGIDEHDVTIVNSNGIAADPKGKHYAFGGELQSPPTGTVVEQVEKLSQIKKWVKNILNGKVTVNYRANLHIHIRVPGLKEDLKALKQLARFNAIHLPIILPQIDPLKEFRFNTADQVDHVLYSFGRWNDGQKRRLRRNRASHHTIIPDYRTDEQLKANTIEEFFAAEVPKGKGGNPLWACQPRAAVNVRQLRETDTIEFRHFFGTLDEDQFANALYWCQEYLCFALFKPDIDTASILRLKPKKLPPQRCYCHWQEVSYRATARTLLPPTLIKEHIHAILQGTFDWKDIDHLSR